MGRGDGETFEKKYTKALLEGFLEYFNKNIKERNGVIIIQKRGVLIRFGNDDNFYVFPRFWEVSQKGMCIENFGDEGTDGNVHHRHSLA